MRGISVQGAEAEYWEHVIIDIVVTKGHKVLCARRHLSEYLPTPPNIHSTRLDVVIVPGADVELV